MSDSFVYRRPALAGSLTRELQGEAFPISHSSGLFLSAPRRTGKSTFLREDLVPALRAAGHETVYVDFWSDRSADPAALLTAALRDALEANASRAGRMGRRVGLTKVGLGSFASFDLAKPSLGGGTLTDALRELAKRSGRRVALILDEAQHAGATEAGQNAMFALKAARDALNMGDAGTGVRGPNLTLVMTGSNRDRLAGMVSNSKQPFYGASVTAFPLLGREYTDTLTAWMNRRLAADNALRHDAVWEAFESVGQRPEHLNALIAQAALLSSRGSSSMADLLADQALSFRRQAFAEFEVVREGLTPLQTAVLVQIVADGRDFSPYAAGTLEAYASRTGAASVSKSEAQGAINALREKGLVWRSERGEYAVEDEAVARWMADEAGLSPGP